MATSRRYDVSHLAFGILHLYFSNVWIMSTAAALFRHLDFRRSYAGRPIVGDDLL
jgi:hypothetical protein